MKRDYGELFEHVEDSVAYWASVPLAEFSRSLDRLLVTQGVTRARLANFLGCSRPYVTKVLSGEENLTATTMARFAKAVGAVVHVHVAARDAAVYWRESHDGMGSVKGNNILP